MVEPVDPLQRFEKMANEDGTPSDYFIRQWQNLINLVTATVENEDGVVANAAAIEALQAIEIIPGTGLEGGGDLTDDVTIGLEDTTVVAGTFGSATQSAQITFDAQGRATAAVNVTISGGGGGGGGAWAWPTSLGTSVSGASFAFKGYMITPLVDFTVSGFAAILNTTAGHTYMAAVYRVDGSDEIDEITGESSTQASPGTLTKELVYIPFSSAITLTAGSRYAMVVGRTDGADTFGFPIYFDSTPDLDTTYTGVPATPFSEDSALMWSQARIAQAAPAIGDTVTVSGLDDVLFFGINYAM